MALQFTRTDTATGHSYTVYAQITDALISLADGTANITLSLYDSSTAAAGGLAPVLPDDKIVLTPAEATTLRTSGLATLYTILLARPAYSTATSV